MDMQGFWTVVMAVCAGVVALGGALSVLDRWRNRARKPLDDNTSKLNDHESYLASDKRRIERLEQHQESNDRQNRLMLKALVMLLDHEIDGNHVDRLQAVSAEIQAYLIER